MSAIKPELRDYLISAQGNRCGSCGNRQDKRNLHVVLMVLEHSGGKMELGNVLTLCARCRDMKREVDRESKDLRNRIARLAVEQNHICARCREPQTAGEFQPAATRLPANGQSVKALISDVDQVLCDRCHYANSLCNSCRNDPDVIEHLPGERTQNRTSAAISNGYALGICSNCFPYEPLPEPSP